MFSILSTEVSNPGVDVFGMILSTCGLCCFQEVLRNLVKRYVAAMIRDAKTEEGLTEENFKVRFGFL